MSYEQLISSLGFSQDPFASWDADSEDRLEDYFIEPPFFNAVYGDPRNPKAVVVFAPRGGGKTALRRMVEKSSPGDGVVCVSYYSFPLSGLKLGDVNLDYHLSNVIILVLVGLVGFLVSEQQEARLSQKARRSLYWLLRFHLSTLKQTELQDAIISVRSLTQTAREWWNNALRIAKPILAVVMAAVGAAPIEIEQLDAEDIDLGPLLDQLAAINALAREIGISSIFVLVDRVDENELTGNDASKAFSFIAPMLQNLNLLQLGGYGFKFFLWDLLQPPFNTHCRPDRVMTFELSWTIDQLKTMLASRLSAYSSGRHNSLKSLVTYSGPVDLDEIIAFLAQGSPRNVIRLCQEIIAQQSEIDSAATNIAEAAFVNGVEVFSKKYAEQVIPGPILRDLQKVGRLDFTVTYVYREIFKFTQQAGVQKIQLWLARGMARQIGSIKESEHGKPSNHYVLNEPLFGKYIDTSINIFEFIDRKVRRCGKCGAYNTRDWDLNPVQNCADCQIDIDSRSQGKMGPSQTT